ncbi:MAG: oxygen-independent coproporphyrinogen III oxidase [Proteobacteria bacterium]|nr:oxygen-independent coproporphyrinogen III oxidase [Pseudomonadota bacterium]
MTEQTLVFDRELIRRYDRQGPRYTSYPTAVQFHDGFGVKQYLEQARCTNEAAKPAPLSLYFHIPFCATVCFYCACNKVVTKNQAHTLRYLDCLSLEIERQGKLFDKSRKVEQLHWGGGTPTFLNQAQMQRLMDETRKNFSLHDDDEGEYSIEIDPRTVDVARIGFLRALGFNRLSMGVQDFDPIVQKAVNRVQSEDQTLAIIHAARETGFHSVSLDLIYGLPFQSVDSFDQTLTRVVEASPDRISVFNYAHLPHLFKTQRQIDETALPAPEEKLRIFRHAIERLTGAGYVYIGMDHFAKPFDELAVAQREGKLSRNFQGYATHGDCDIVGMGVSAIGRIGRSYSQNERDLEQYQMRIETGGLAVFRGVGLTGDDVLRRDVINQLICHFELKAVDYETRYAIDFWVCFAAEREQLTVMQEDGLLKMDSQGLQVLPAGRLLIRNICMVFDYYLNSQADDKVRYSKVI